MTSFTPDELRVKANQIRRRDLQAVFEAGAGHIGGEMSVTDILTALYFSVLNVDPNNPLDPNRDRLVLSKGHTACVLYVTLAERGFIPKEEIATFLQPMSRLNGHPDRNKVPGVETNTGPLGHGLPVAVGMAKAAKISGADWKTFVITGDGEMQEGSNWEAIMAAAQFGLDNLTLIIDHNRLQQGARLADTNNLAPIAPRLAAFGWEAVEVDGHNMDELVAAMSPEGRTTGKPRGIVAHTNKGQGISFMSDNVAWHHKVPSADQYAQAMAELEEAAK
ncbi:transketolase [Tropicimonas sediminicola]|uniref:Transketolase subunit A n=1 Tax=Tropicimonas sediminicola TaxID=1031541 RepID=A0A239M1I7_9RHOB|nr:transketolase [Tropicimonas sediminicola]SNT36410.1 transketolase subunit A [Tropicimonas sediminicola]